MKLSRGAGVRMDLEGKEVPITFWEESRERRSPLSTSNGAPKQTITAGRIFMKILPEMHLKRKKSPLYFESHPESADLHQRPITKSTDKWGGGGTRSTECPLIFLFFSASTFTISLWSKQYD